MRKTESASNCSEWLWNFWPLGSCHSLTLPELHLTREHLQSTTGRLLHYLNGWYHKSAGEDLQLVDHQWSYEPQWGAAALKGEVLELFQTLSVQSDARHMGVFRIMLDAWNTFIHWNSILNMGVIFLFFFSCSSILNLHFCVWMAMR